MYKMIACDLDETLLSSDRSISEHNIEAIKQATGLGVKFVPATGRGYNSVGGTLEKLGLLDKENEYVISYNGGAVTENRENKLLHFEGISFALAQELYRRGLSYNVCIHVYTKEMVYAYRFWQEEMDYLAGRMEVTEIFTENLDFLAGQDIVKVLYMNTDYSYLKKIEEELKDITGEIDVSYSSNRYIEFNRKGVNKGSGLMFLANRLGIKPEETIAIGDNFNDLSMLRAAGLGVGVQNTIKEMKPLCDYITTATNNESAVAEVIEKFVLSKMSCF
ncbi:MAG: Cof-type HAD-IIB family hydrolase [Clostridium sp.]|nr:Cof-type HAD-IIB family hydrolase [Clostridium sp.]